MTGKRGTKGEAKPSPKRRKRESRPDEAGSNISPGSERAPSSSHLSPRARAHDRVMRARAVERVAAGEGVVAVSRELGVDRTTVQRWVRDAGVYQKQALTMEEAAERGRKKLVAAAEGAARRVVELVHQVIVDKGEASGARVNLSAALEVLNRVGLHPKQGVEVTDNTLTSIFDRYAREPDASADAPGS